MSFEPLRDPQRYVILKGKRSPGIARLENANSPRKWEELNGYGMSGGILRFRGIGLSKFKLIISLYTDQDWIDWHAWRKTVERTPRGRRPKFLPIVNPILQDLKIDQVAVLDVGQPVEKDDRGLFEVTIELQAHIKHKRQLAKPEGTEKPEESTDFADVMIRNLTDQVQSLL